MLKSDALRANIVTQTETLLCDLPIGPNMKQTSQLSRTVGGLCHTTRNSFNRQKLRSFLVHCSSLTTLLPSAHSCNGHGTDVMCVHLPQKLLYPSWPGTLLALLALLILLGLSITVLVIYLCLMSFAQNSATPVVLVILALTNPLTGPLAAFFGFPLTSLFTCSLANLLTGPVSGLVVNLLVGS